MILSLKHPEKRAYRPQPAAQCYSDKELLRDRGQTRRANPVSGIAFMATMTTLEPPKVASFVFGTCGYNLGRRINAMLAEDLQPPAVTLLHLHAASILVTAWQMRSKHEAPAWTPLGVACPAADRTRATRYSGPSGQVARRGFATPQRIPGLNEK